MNKKEFRSPEEVFGQLFYDVHRNEIIEDGKLFADAVAKVHPEIILKTYKEEKNKEGFDLRSFIDEYFIIPVIGTDKEALKKRSINDHLEKLWIDLQRAPDKIKKNRTSKIPLPYPYIVPGGRFNEIYYWDSYFTMLGLEKSGHVEIIEHMVNNFRFMIDEFGHIPNGNRSYFLSRSQPPFYSLMVKLLIQLRGQEIIPRYLPSLVKEYNFWMKGLAEISELNSPLNRVIKLEGDVILNRYYDDKSTPREEMFGDDWKLINFGTQLENQLFLELRAACESGWDFSSRWFSDPQDLSSIHATEILPLDLNCLLWHLEKLISECYGKVDEAELSLNYGIIAHNRKKAIQKLFFNERDGFFYDYNWKKKTLSSRKTIAAAFPLYFKLCTEQQAKSCAEVIENEFLKDGGVLTTLETTGQQWDAPNGWAPLQWITIQGLLKNGFKTLAQEIAHRWTTLNRNVFERTGKMLEKYNVEDTTLEGGGGEYPVQDGFGWTNGVYLALTK